MARPSLRDRILHGLAADANGSGVEPTLIETEIVGQFSGIENETIFYFANGQRWQQVGMLSHYHSVWQPRVTLNVEGQTGTLVVPGMPFPICVRRLS